MEKNRITPAEQVVEIINRVYRNGLTTTSGGNLSIKDENGDIWITPSGIDKGTLTTGDICCVKQNGTVLGKHRPSVELPFHAAVYRRRPDLRALLHAHPAALVTFSSARVLPDIRLSLGAYRLLGCVTSAAYELPGSSELGECVAAEFAKGFDSVMMDSHGVVVGAEDLFEAYKKFEAFEMLARIELNARKLQSKLMTINEEDLLPHEWNRRQSGVPETLIRTAGTSQAADNISREMAALIRRAYRQGLCYAAQYSLSVRLPESTGAFLYTPQGIDCAYISENDIVFTAYGKEYELHQAIYDKHPKVNAIITASPVHTMAFAVTSIPLNARVIPESYILLRDVKKLPFPMAYSEPEQAADCFSPKTPVIIFENDQIVSTGTTPLQAFDRLEVMELTATAVLKAADIGSVTSIPDDEIAKIDSAFKLEG